MNIYIANEINERAIKKIKIRNKFSVKLKMNTKIKKANFG
jgi:hypothetical protein